MKYGRGNVYGVKEEDSWERWVDARSIRLGRRRDEVVELDETVCGLDVDRVTLDHDC